MNWPISENWAVSRDTRNWISQERKGNRWRSIGWYPTPEKLLLSLYRKLCRTETKQSDLLAHVEHQSTVVEACSTRLAEYINAGLGEHLHDAAQPRTTTAKLKQSEPKNLSLDLPEPATQ